MTQPCAALGHLTDLAKLQKLHLGIKASDQPRTRERAGVIETWRELTWIELKFPGAPKPAAAAPIINGDIEAAALDLLSRVTG